MTLLPPCIEHIRDVILGDQGQIEQIYNHLVYRFGADTSIVARAYFDEPYKVSILSSGGIPDEVMGYLKERFWQIDRLGGAGYETIWEA